MMYWRRISAIPNVNIKLFQCKILPNSTMTRKYIFSLVKQTIE